MIPTKKNTTNNDSITKNTIVDDSKLFTERTVHGTVPHAAWDVTQAYDTLVNTPRGVAQFG